ncbi:MAG: hypothetical protein QHI38_06300 [Armatimonadota bacterium]|nr:hypothetical protein [Armatimonadota bacterium]
MLGHKTLWQRIAVLSAVILVALVVWLVAQPRKSVAPHVLLVIWDCSKSADHICNRVIPWGIRLFSQAPPDAKVVVCRMSRDTVTVVNFTRLPAPEKVQQDFPQLLSVEKQRGTRPLTGVRYACQFAQRYKDWLVAVAMFTDGQNDYPADMQELRDACRALVAMPNVVRIGLFGLDPLDRKSVADWEGCFSGSAKVMICTRHLGNTEEGIGEFCKLFGKDIITSRAK